MAAIINVNKPIKAGIDLTGKCELFGGDPSVNTYRNRVIAGGGAVISESTIYAIQRFFQDNNLVSNTDLLLDANSGMVQRIDGVLKYIRTAFDLSSAANNLDGSATATAQPRLVGGIAPNSKFAASNQNGEARKFVHTLIDYSATGIWSVSSVINLMGDSANDRVIASDSTGSTVLKNKTTTNVFSFTNSAGATVNGTINNSAYIGKSTRWMFIANGTTLKIYANAVLFDTLTVSTVAKFNTLFTSLSAKIYNYRLQSGELTAAQVLSESTFLTSLYPEIESTVIGTQEWATRNFEAVCTPAGNVIPEMQAAAIGADKVTNGSFTSTANWDVEAGVTFSSDGDIGTIISNGTFTGISQAVSSVLNKWHKVIINIKNTTANVRVYISNQGFYTIPINADFTTYTLYIKGSGTLNKVYILPSAAAQTVYVDDFSVQELGWANATEIYDAVYAATAGDATAKTYAALKESGMWCYYNNDAANGAIYSKLYNWYAAKLFDLDMASASFGWHVLTSDEFTTLQTYLGGEAVAGGKMKMTGLDYWTTPNTGADNSSGFTSLAAGARNQLGSFINNKFNNGYYVSDISGSEYYNLYNSTELNYFSANPIFGVSIRLIKNI